MQRRRDDSFADENQGSGLSDPSQALDRVDPVATSDNTTSQTADLGGVVTAGASAAVESVTSGAQGSGNPLTISHTTAAGTNRYMLVWNFV